jgi:hypothetical protein
MRKTGKTAGLSLSLTSKFDGACWSPKLKPGLEAKPQAWLYNKLQCSFASFLKQLQSSNFYKKHFSKALG